MNTFSHPIAVFIFQLIIILVTVRICGALFKKLRQPAVIGEMIAGILLGPSVLATMCNIGNIAYELNRELQWNPSKETFNDE